MNEINQNDLAAVKSTIKQLMVELFDVDIAETDIIRNQEGWDSLTNVRFIIALENEFGIKIAPEDLPAMKSIEQIAELILLKRS